MPTSRPALPQQEPVPPSPEPSSQGSKQHKPGSRRDSTHSTQSSTTSASRRSDRPTPRQPAAPRKQAPVVAVPHPGHENTSVPAVQPCLRVTLVLVRVLQLGACGISMYANHQGLQGLKMMRAMGMPNPGGAMALGGPAIAMTIVSAMLSLLWMWLAAFPKHRPHALCTTACSHIPAYVSDMAWDALLVCWWAGMLVALLLAHVPTPYPIVACSMLAGLHLISAALSGRACAVQFAADRQARSGVTVSVSVAAGRYRVPGMV